MSDSDRQYRDLADLNPDAFIIQVEGKVVYCNQSARRMFGESETVRLIGMESIELVAPDTRDFILKRRNRVLSTGEPAPYTETRHLRLDGTSFPSEMVVGQVNWGGRAGTMNIIHDITERKRAVDAVAQSEARFRDFAQASSDWFWEMGPDLRFTYHSERYFEITGFRPEEKIGTTRTRYVDPTDREADAEKWAAHLADLETHKPFKNFEYSFASKTGRICHARTSGTPIFDPDGEFRGYRGTGTDITEHKRAEEELRQSEQRFKDIANSSADWFWERDENGRLTYISDRYQPVTGVDPKQLMGKTRDEILKERKLPPEYEEEYHKFRPYYRERKPYRDIRFKVLLPGGRVRHWRMSGWPKFDDKGGFKGYRGATTDVTDEVRAEEALRESEARYRAIVEDQTELICRYLPDQTFTFVNDSYCRYFHQAREDLIGRKFAPLIPDEDLEIVMQRLAALNPDRPLITHEHRVVAPGGEIRWHLWTDRAIFDTEGRVIEYQSVGRDITDQKSVDAQLRQAQKMEALGQLAGGTAHEINNLLQPIITFASLTRDEIEDPEHRHNLDRVLECGRRAKEIVADILTFARRAPGKPDAIEVRELLMTTVRFVRDHIPSTIELRSEISTDTGQALINRTEFTQVIINLAQNAADAIDKAGTISITTEIVDLGGRRAIQRQLSDGRYCRVSVKDTGSGMASDTLKRIFEPFFTTKPAGKGTGLGLSVVYGIVTGWGGSVSADSVVGEGSVFEVNIPLMQ